MNIKIEYSQTDRIEISVSQDITVKELTRWHLLVSQLLALAFEGKHVGLVTIEPQVYSLGYEIEEHRIMYVEEKTVLTNVISAVSSEFLYEIARCEEFNRGLLRIFCTTATSSASLSKDHVLGVVRGGSAQVVPKPLLYCDDDGRLLYWLDLQAPIERIQEVITGMVK